MQKRNPATFALWLQQFSEHSDASGMDTVRHVRDPTNPTETVDILKAHPKFTVESARAEMAHVMPLWDPCDQANNRDMVRFLLGSVDRRSEQVLRQDKMDDDESFVVMWMLLIRAMYSVSFTHYTDIKDKIRVLEPGTFLVRISYRWR